MAIKVTQREKFSSTTYNHKGRLIKSSFNNSEYEKFLSRLELGNHEVGYIPAGYENRPDLIADIFYSQPNLWWVIMEANAISDVFEDLDPGVRINIPKF